MQNKKPLYQPWNEDAFLSCVFVRGMTAVQRWMYRTLLQSAFFHSTRPYLPKDDRVLWILAGCESKSQWEENKEVVLACFTVAEHDHNLLENKRVTDDWDHLTESRERMSELGQRSVVVRGALNGRSTDVKRALNGRSTYVKRALNVGSTSTVQYSTDTDTEEQSKEKKSEDTAEDSVSGQEPTRSLGCEWKNLALKHRSYFHTKASVRFKDKYVDACSRFTEQVVLDCFDLWAPGAVDWVKREGIGNPLHAFFKKLPDEAQDALEITEAEREQATAAAVQSARAADEKKADAEFMAASIERQTQEIVQRLNAHPVANEMSLEDLMKE